MVLYTEFRTESHILSSKALIWDSVQANFDIYALFEISLKLILNCTGLLHPTDFVHTEVASSAHLPESGPAYLKLPLPPAGSMEMKVLWNKLTHC